MSLSNTKVYKSAVCVIPPLHLWSQIQRIRAKHDKSFLRWPPHVNLLYPFWEDKDDRFRVASAQATQALASVQPFQVTLQQFDYFSHGKRCTLWLDPCSEGLIALQASLKDAFPDCDDLNLDATRGITEFVPHLSLGQWGAQVAVQRAAQAFGERFDPVTFTVTEVALISRQGFTDPFTVRYTVPVGSSTEHAAYGEPQQVDLQYDAPAGGYRPRTIADEEGQEEQGAAG